MNSVVEIGNVFKKYGVSTILRKTSQANIVNQSSNPYVDIGFEIGDIFKKYNISRPLEIIRYTK